MGFRRFLHKVKQLFIHDTRIMHVIEDRPPKVQGFNLDRVNVTCYRYDENPTRKHVFKCKIEPEHDECPLLELDLRTGKLSFPCEITDPLYAQARLFLYDKIRRIMFEQSLPVSHIVDKLSTT